MNKLFRSKFTTVVFIFLILFALCALYAPLLAASKPLFVVYEGDWYSPLFRYLLYPGYYTKPLDRFFNLLMIFSPFIATGLYLFKKHRSTTLFIFSLVLFTLFGYFQWNPIQNPAWSQSDSSNTYSKLNQLIEYHILKNEQERTLPYLPAYHALLENRKGKSIPMDPSILPTLWNQRQERIQRELKTLQLDDTQESQHRIQEIQDKEKWLSDSQSKLHFLIMPLIRPYHWQDDRGGNQLLNEVVPWYELSRINRKDLTAALIFGTRISLVVGFVTVLIALAIGIPFGAIAGFYGGKFDIVLSRVLEVWEAMPVLFMLLTIVAITEAKSIFWIILTIGIFGWTGFARYVRAETLRVKKLAFVEASKAIGYGNMHTLFSHILPNSLSSVLVLIPFAILGAISAESGLSFLGLGEEGSCSLGVLMDEGRTNFPAESYLLWPPAIVLSLLLIAIALLNDAVRDAIDPRVD